VIDWEKVSLENLAGFLSDQLREQGIDIILVGGACVTYYSLNRYQSYDLDFVVYEDMKKVRQALNELGFSEKGGYFHHDKCKWLVEFVASPVAVGKQIITDFKCVKVSTGTIKMLRVEDSVKDRLASFFFWDDRQGLDQAIDVCLEHDINFKEVEEWSTQEGCKDKFHEFLERLRKKQIK
jgi:predicted nucleotidyltransferase